MATRESTADRFSMKVVRILERRAGGRCTICRCLTGGPGTAGSEAVNIGVAAHITAASPSGPRYDPALSSEQRRSVENGIWACQNCGHKVDHDVAGFAVAELQHLKQRAEERARLELGVPGACLAAPSNTPGAAEVRMLEQQRTALQEVFGRHLPEIHTILGLSVRKDRTRELLDRALPVHLALEEAAALFMRRSEQGTRAALLDLGQMVGTWPNDAWPIRTRDFQHLEELTRRLEVSRDEIDERLTPRPQLDGRVLDLFDAGQEWFDALCEFRYLTPESYERLQPLEVLAPLRRRFERSYLLAQVLAPKSLSGAFDELRARLLLVHSAVSTKPRPDRNAVGGLTEQAHERRWESLLTTQRELVCAIRKYLGSEES